MLNQRKDIHYRKGYENPVAVSYAHIEIVELEPIDCREPNKRIEVYLHTGKLVWSFDLSRGPHAIEAWRLNLQYAKKLLNEMKKLEVPPKK